MLKLKPRQPGFRKLTASGFSHHAVLMLFVVVFGVAGVGFLVISHADPFTNGNPNHCTQAQVSPAAASGLSPLSGYYNPGSHDHYYTLGRNDVALAALGFCYDTGVDGNAMNGYAYSTSMPGTVALREYLNWGAGRHFYTTAPPSVEPAASLGYKYSRIVAYVSNVTTPQNGLRTIFRAYDHVHQDHFYMTSGATLFYILHDKDITYEGVIGSLWATGGSSPTLHPSVDVSKVTCTTSISPGANVVAAESALSPGQTLCLHGGTYGSASTEFNFTHSGTPGSSITVRSYPGERALIHGHVYLSANYFVFSNFDIDGDNTFFNAHRSEDQGCLSYTQPVTDALHIAGSNIIFQDNNLYQSVPAQRGVGVLVGDNTGVQATDVTIRRNRIHDVGGCKAFDHVIYMAHASGAQVYQNWLYNDQHGWGIQVYPGTQNSHIYSNVIDNVGAGLVVGGESGPVSNGNLIEKNVISRTLGLPSNNVPKAAITSYWGGPVGTGNSFLNNISWSNDLLTSSGLSGVSIGANQTANPLYANAAQNNYVLQANSPAAGLGLWDGTYQNQ